MTTREDEPSRLERARQKRLKYDGREVWDWCMDEAQDYNDEDCIKAAREDAITIECWKFESEKLPSSLDKSDNKVKYIKEDKVTDWLDEPRPTRDGQLACAWLRLIHKSRSRHDECPFDMKTFAAINDKFGLPAVDLHSSSQKSGACGRFMLGDSNVILVCRSMNSLYTISSTLRHDFKTGITVGYISSRTEFRIHDAILGIPQQFLLGNHPLLIPLLMMERMLQEPSRDYGLNDQAIYDVEVATGFHGFSRVIPDGHDDPDCRQLAKQLGKAAGQYGFAKARLSAIMLVHEFCFRQLKSCQSWIPKDKWQNYKEATAKLVERAEYSASHINHLLGYRALEMRLQVQQNVIFNLIAQEDNRTNILLNRTNIQLSNEMREIAVKTKQDGSIMKIIAFLGTLFLPATFVSTFFAMPFFRLGAPTTSEIVGAHFWIYWAVTIPLTILTMTIVSYWTMSQTQKTLNDEDSHDGQNPSRLRRLNEKLNIWKRKLPVVEDQV